MTGHKKERQLQINETQVFSAAASERGAEPVQSLAGSGLRVRHKLRQLFASLELTHCLEDKGMTRQRLVERLENRQRFFRRAVARDPAAIGLNHAQRGRVELVGVLETLAGFLLVAGGIVDHARVQIFED